MSNVNNTTFIVDLRSDTVTKPTKAMKHAMVNSALGDDVYGEDPTVNALESKVATLLGKQAALFVPSGTMANLIAGKNNNSDTLVTASIRSLKTYCLYPNKKVMVHCNKRGSEAFAGHLSHIYKYEQGGASHLGRVLLSTLRNNPDGTFDISELENHLRGSDLHEPLSSMVAIENTHNVCGGKVLPQAWVDELGVFCASNGLALHMDGARLLDAAAYSDCPAASLVQPCHSVSICFSKGLSAPVGSALAGSYHFIEQARRVRKMLGGGMRQAGVLAAAAVVALDEVAPALLYSHKRARVLAATIQGLFLPTFSVEVSAVHTNIVLVRLAAASSLRADSVLQRLAQVCLAETQGDCKTSNDEGVIVKAVCFDAKTIRFTLHRDVQDEQLHLAIMKIVYVFKELDAANPFNADKK